MSEILKLKELPNDGLETSWGALWLGIRTFLGFNVDYPRPQGPCPLTLPPFSPMPWPGGMHGAI